MKCKKNWQEEIWDVVRQIPKGFVSTYGDIAKAVGRDPSYEGLVVSQSFKNAPNDVPYHRVVNSQGKMAAGYPGGIKAQRIKLLNEKVPMKTNFTVNMHVAKYYPDAKKVVRN